MRMVRIKIVWNENGKYEGEKMYISSTSALSAFPDGSYVEKGLFVSPSFCRYLLDKNIYIRDAYLLQFG